MKRVKDVDEYIARAPKEIGGKLRQLRATIKSTAPMVEERISYGMPYYDYKGPVIYFSYAKKHIGLYALPANIAAHKEELKQYSTSKGTIRLPLDEKLPIALIKKLVKARIKTNEESEKKK